jgi:glucosylceramidase
MTSNRPRVAALAAGALLVSAGVVAAASPAAAHAPAGAQVYWSSESRTPGYAPKNRNWYLDPATGLAGTPYQLSRQADVRVTAATGAATIAVDPTQQYQKMLGVGSSLEESTISNLAKMDPAARTKALKALVDPRTGAGFNVIRITFGTADFTSHDYYTYDDGAPDPTLSRFSIAQDVDYHIIGVLQEALRINPRIKFFGSAWSPPAWMKDNNSMIAGHLLTEWIPTLATYYRKALQAYAAYGIPIYGMTLQNEPEYSGTYPSTLVSAEQERQLAVALHAELVANHLQKTKLWAYDHNFRDIINYSAGVYGPPATPTDAYPFVDGMAVHDYSGTPSQMGTVYNTYPGKDVLMTERSVWGTVGADRLIHISGTARPSMRAGSPCWTRTTPRPAGPAFPTRQCWSRAPLIRTRSGNCPTIT